MFILLAVYWLSHTDFLNLIWVCWSHFWQLSSWELPFYCWILKLKIAANNFEIKFLTSTIRFIQSSIWINLYTNYLQIYLNSLKANKAMTVKCQIPKVQNGYHLKLGIFDFLKFTTYYSHAVYQRKFIKSRMHIQHNITNVKKWTRKITREAITIKTVAKI